VTLPAFDDGAASKRPLDLLGLSFRVGSTFGVEVRVYWLAALLVPIAVVACLAPRVAHGTEWLTLSGLTLALLFAIAWSHEVSHALGARWFGVRAPRVVLSPLSPIAHPMPATDRPRAELFASLFGPLAHALWLAVLLPMAHDPRAVEPPAGWNNDPLTFTLDFAVFVNGLLLVLNLLPCFPLDGGRALRAALAQWMPQGHATRIAAGLGLLGGLALVLYGVRTGELFGGVLAVIGLTNLFACIEMRRDPGPLRDPTDDREPRDVWQVDPDAWRTGAELFPFERDTTDAQPPMLTRTRNRTTALMDSEPTGRDDGAAELDAQLDRVLVRIHEIGLPNLTDAEREILQRASRKLRGTG
jgi:Zn-dependent protease